MIRGQRRNRNQFSKEVENVEINTLDLSDNVYKSDCEEYELEDVLDDEADYGEGEGLEDESEYEEEEELDDESEYEDGDDQDDEEEYELDDETDYLDGDLADDNPDYEEDGPDNGKGELEEFDLDVEWISAKQRIKARVSDSLLSIVNTAKHGRRVSISNEMLKELGVEQFVKIATRANQIIITTASSAEGSFQLKPGKKRRVVYSKELVEQLTEILGLSFAEQTSISFSQVKYKKHKSQVFAIIS